MIEKLLFPRVNVMHCSDSLPGDADGGMHARQLISITIGATSLSTPMDLMQCIEPLDRALTKVEMLHIERVDYHA
jgi:hypothetical protein